MTNLIEVTSVPAIVAIVYAAMAIYKKVFEDKEKMIKLIPIIAAGLGAVLGVIAYYAAPETIAASNILTAILLGQASGFAATGAHQLFKQLSKKEENKEGQGSESEEENE